MKLKPTHKVKIDDIHDFNTKVSRGTGVIKAKKGKGSYKRKPKHNKDWRRSL